MLAARAAWVRWSTERPQLRVVEDLADIHVWTRSVLSREANEVLGVLAAMTDSEFEAITALVWALLPGAEALARRLADLPDSEGLVAGRLWIEASQPLLHTRRVAGAILACTRRQVSAELGVGDLAARRDRVWADAVCVADATQLEPAGRWESQDELIGQVEPEWTPWRRTRSTPSTRGCSIGLPASPPDWRRRAIAVEWIDDSRRRGRARRHRAPVAARYSTPRHDGAGSVGRVREGPRRSPSSRSGGHSTQLAGDAGRGDAIRDHGRVRRTLL